MIQYLKKNAPKTIKWEVKNLHNAGVAITEKDSVGVRAMAKGLEQVWANVRSSSAEGGSIGVVVQLQQYAGVESVLTVLVCLKITHIRRMKNCICQLGTKASMRLSICFITLNKFLNTKDTTDTKSTKP